MRRELNGLLVLDKPAGITSAGAVAAVKKALGAGKVGHTGTLDPFATGVLLCCVNQATRLARFFLHGPKRYQALMRLGVETDTQDATGRPLACHPVPDFSEAHLGAVFERFQGSQWQQPPVYAALKHGGTPLYKLARQGRPVQKPARQVNLALRILQIGLPDVRFEVSCSAGTYVRTLCADIGRALGCGGHLTELRRTACGGFTLEQAVTLEAVRRGEFKLVPMEEALKEMPVLRADGVLLQHMLHGKPLACEGMAGQPFPVFQDLEQRPAEFLKVVDEQGELRAVLQSAEGGTKYNYCCVFV